MEVLSMVPGTEHTLTEGSEGSDSVHDDNNDRNSDAKMRPR